MNMFGVLSAAAIVVGHAAQVIGASVEVEVSPVFQQEAVVSGSIASGGSFSTRVFWDGINESRAVYEMPLPVLPGGSIGYDSAVLNYFVNETNSVGPTGSQLTWFSYAGDGKFSPSDASNVGSELATTEDFLLPGPKSTAFNLTRINDLHTSGSPWIGLVAWQNRQNYQTGISRGENGQPAAPKLSLTATVPDVGTVTTGALFDAKAELQSGAFNLVEGDLSIGTLSYAFADIDRRGILEFHLGGIPDGATITSAAITFDVTSFTFDSDDPGPEPRIYGYAGNGSADAADAEETNILLGTSSTVSDLGLHTVNLNTDLVQALLGVNDILGILVRGSADGNQFVFRTMEGADASMFGGMPVSLSVSYAIPEPASLALLGTIGGLLLQRRSRGV